jgi:hypothetical protein
MIVFGDLSTFITARVRTFVNLLLHTGCDLGDGIL